MTEPLRLEVETPAHSRAAVSMIVGTVALAASSLFAASKLAPEPPLRDLDVDTSEAVTAAELVPVADPMPALAEPDPARASEVSFVLSVGSRSFVKLADVDVDHLAMPEHGKPRLISTDDGIESSVATVAVADLPAAYRDWERRDLVIDGACKAKVTGFAVVSRLTGSTGYAGEDAENGWTAKNVLTNGSAMLAAELDGCTGTYARDASLAPIVVLETLGEPDDSQLDQARASILASAAARTTRQKWREYDETKRWQDDATFSFRLLRHPTTGVLWLSGHAHVDHGCGDPEVNIWGLFRINDDGTLTTSQLRELGDLDSIDAFVDLEGDGELELVGKPWLGLDRMITRASGDEIDRLPLAFFGCPC